LTRLARWRRDLKEKAVRGIARRMVPTSTVIARARLRRMGPLKVLVDTSVCGHSVTHGTAWINTGKKMWGHIEIDTGYSARVPVYSRESDLRVFKESRYLAGLAYLAKSNALQFFNSAELHAEQLRQPAGRFRGYGWSDLGIFNDVPFKSVDEHHYFDLENPKEKQLERIASCSDPLFRSLLDLLGEKSSLDAFHIATAEKHGLFCFLHMDFKLERQLEQKKSAPVLRGLKTKIFTPSQFGDFIRLIPLDPFIWIDHNPHGFFSRPDLHLKQ
jgi:hypothetical protein